MSTPTPWDALMTEAESAGDLVFTPVPEGEYVVKVVESNGDKATQKGKTMFKVTLEIQGGQHAGRKLLR